MVLVLKYNNLIPWEIPSLRNIARTKTMTIICFSQFFCRNVGKLGLIFLMSGRTETRNQTTLATSFVAMSLTILFIADAGSARSVAL